METDKIQRCVIYIRVSTAEQQIHGKSLQAQKEHLELYAADNNMKVVGVFADEGKTARKELKRRTAIFRLLEAVKRDKIDVILFWRMDRWFRNVSDFYKVQEVLDEHQTRWIATSEPNINMETREGRLNLNLVLTIGQNEVDTTSERIKFTNESMVRNGKLIFGGNNMPFGYKPGFVNGEKRMVIDEEAEPIVRDVFDYYMTHRAKRQTVKYIQDKYGINYTYTMLRTALSSEFYKGKYRGIDYCPAYLTEEQWNFIQEISKKNIKSYGRKRIYLFSGLLKCPACNRTLAGTGCLSVINRATQEKRMYKYYRCQAAFKDLICENRKRFSENILETNILNSVEDEYNKYRSRYLRIVEEEQKQLHKEDPVKIKREMDRLNYLFRKDRISAYEYEKEYAELEAKLQKVNSEPVMKKNIEYLDGILYGDFKTMYESLDDLNKRAFWHSIIEEIQLDMDYNIREIVFVNQTCVSI